MKVRGMGRKAFSVLFVAGALIGVTAVTASASHAFDDVPSDHTFHDDISWLADVNVTKGCNPPFNDEFCPDDSVTRGQMAAFMVRALGLTASGPTFSDTAGHTFEADISKLAEAGITKGCNPPANTQFCPNDPVTRGQMAAFMVRALGLSASGPSFSDTAGHTFEADISKLARAGITKGCNPPANTRFCPNDPVTRGQMAAFLRRALEDKIAVTTYLSDLDYVDRDSSFPSNGAVDINGGLYANSVRWTVWDGDAPEWVEYDLGRDYASFCVVAGVTDDSDATSALDLEVYGDGASLGVWSVSLGDPAQISVPVANVLRLRIEARPGTTTDFASEVAWGNAFVSNQSDCNPPAPDSSPTPVPETYLSNLSYVNRDSSFPQNGAVDIDGQVYTRSVSWTVWDSDDPEWVEYDIGRDFRRFCAVVGATDDSDVATEYDVEVYIDGISIFTGDVAFGSPAEVDVNVTNGLRLRIEARPGTTNDFAGSVAWGDARVITSSSC